MPAKSKSQFRLMAAICNGNYPDGHRGISREVACEFIHKTDNPSALPQKVAKKSDNNYYKNTHYKLLYKKD